MDQQDAPAEPCYLACADHSFHFDGGPQLREDCGAIIYEIDGYALAEELIRFYYREVPDRPFDLRIIRQSQFKLLDLVYVRRQISQAHSIANNLHCELYRTNDPTLRGIGLSVEKLASLEGELRLFLRTTGLRPGQETADTGTPQLWNALPVLPAATSLERASERLEFCLERHRLMFLYFAGAMRLREGLQEFVRQDEIRGWEAFTRSVDTEGEFLFKERWFLDRYADEAVVRFGSCDATDDTAKNQTRFWCLEEGSSTYLEASSDAVRNAVSQVRHFDKNKHWSDLLLRCLEVTHDNGSPRWYATSRCSWSYLGALDTVIAEVRKLAATAVSQAMYSVPSGVTTTGKSHYYLRVSISHEIYNEDPDALGKIAGSDYFPLYHEAFYFFRTHDERIGRRLLALFERRLKPEIDEDGDRRVRARFSLRASNELDDNDQFLADEELDQVSKEMRRARTSWRVKQGLVVAGNQIVRGEEWLSKSPPLDANASLQQRLHDQASRWEQSLLEQAATASVRDADPVGGSSPEAAIPAPASIRRRFIPDAVSAVIALRDILRVTAAHPGLSSNQTVTSIESGLREQVIFAADICHLNQILDIEDSAPSENWSELKLTLMATLFASWHPDIEEIPFDEIDDRMAAMLSLCQRQCRQAVRDLSNGFLEFIFAECREPLEHDDQAVRMAHAVALLDSYWSIIKQHVIAQMNSLVMMQPCPFVGLLRNLEDRMSRCLARLSTVGECEQVKEQISQLLEMLLSSEPDDLQVVPECTYGCIISVDEAIERLRLTTGPASTLARSEELAISYCAAAFAQYKKSIENASKQLLKPPAVQGASKSPPTRKVPSPDERSQTTVENSPLHPSRSDEKRSGRRDERRVGEEPADVAARLSNHEALELCRSWQDEALERGSGKGALSDSMWLEKCEVVEILAERLGLSSQALVSFRTSCKAFGIPSDDDCHSKLRPANEIVESMMNRLAAQTTKNSDQNGHLSEIDSLASSLSGTRQHVLRAMYKLNAVAMKVSANAIAEAAQMDNDARLRTELSNLRERELVGGNKGERGYSLTPLGFEVAKALSKTVS